MAQVGWVYLDNVGGRHRVGLYHGDRTGHVVIHVNTRIVQIDFSVLQSKTYSFFIEDEFCEIVIEKHADHFEYGFEVNKTVDTPRNRERRVEEGRNKKHMAIFIGSILALTFIALIIFRNYDRLQDQRNSVSIGSNLSEANEQRLVGEGRSTLATLFVVQEATARKVYYSFLTADSTQVSGYFSAADTGPILLPNGFPLVDRDEYNITYLPANPQVNRLDFYQPSPPTLDAYQLRAAKEELRNHPNHSAEYNACVVAQAMRQKGWVSMGHFINQQVSPNQNERFNSDTYGRLKREAAFEKEVKEACWDK
jgi:hypothetical protein